MNLSNEDRLLSRLLKGFPHSSDVVVGPGDDCAVVRIGTRTVLLKTDCVAEGVHFLRDEDPVRVGWKAMCRPLSDIAAMGGVPKQALITIFSPPDLGREYWVSFYRGLRRAARRFGVVVAGGELSSQRSGIAVSVALTGEAPGGRYVTRSGGGAGDVLFVTGQLGGSISGHHLDFVPRLREGRWLAGRASAMMDLSDGLGSDLPRLAQASGCGFSVDAAALPLRRGSSVEGALTDGEDYELLCAVPRQRAAGLLSRWRGNFPRTRLTPIGCLEEAGRFPAAWLGGWDHFSVVTSAGVRQRAARSSGRRGRQHDKTP